MPSCPISPCRYAKGLDNCTPDELAALYFADVLGDGNDA
jgi:hypothetical protein